MSGLKEITNGDVPYTTIMKDKYNGLENGKHMSHMYVNTAETVSTSLSRKGVSITFFDIFTHFMFDIVLLKIMEYTKGVSIDGASD